MIRKKHKLAVNEFNGLLNTKQRFEDKIAKVQRKKDLKVDTINKKYESKLDKLVRKQNELDILVRNSQEYITNIE